MQDQSKVARCLFCDSANVSFRFTATDRWHEVEGTYDLHQCCDCGLLFLSPQPSAQQIAAHYPSTYYAFQGEHPDTERDEKLYEIFYGSNSHRLKRILYSPFRLVIRTLEGGPGKRLLDVGCGSGQFLAIAKKVCHVEAFGVEPYSTDHSFATDHQLQIFNGTLEDAAFPDNFFDVVTLNHVFEHVSNPRSTLAELKRILKPHGTLILAVPQSSNLLFWLFGKCWKQLDVPRHNFIPSTKNLKKLAELQGFAVKQVRYNSTPSSILGTLFYWRNDRSHRRAYLNSFKEGQLAFRSLLPLSFFLNVCKIGDQIELVLIAS